MLLADPPEKYDRADQSDVRATLEREDARNVKRGTITEFTPTLGDGTNNYSMTQAHGTLKVIDGRAFVDLYLAWDSIGSAGAGQLRVGGFPVPTSGTVGAPRFSASFGYVEGLDTTGTLNQITANMLGGVTTLFFWRTNDNASPTSLPANGSSAAGQLHIHINYNT